MRTFKDFLRWYNNKDVDPTLEAMQKMVDFYNNKGIDMLKLGCTLRYLKSICLHKSTSAKFDTSQKATTIYWGIIGKAWLVDHPLCLHGKL